MTVDLEGVGSYSSLAETESQERTVPLGVAMLSTTTLPQQVDRVICHCLQVKESQLREQAALYAFTSIGEIKNHCGAGTGCRACHAKIRKLLMEQNPLAAELDSDC